MNRNRNRKDDEPITTPGRDGPLSDMDHTVGQLMVESINHRQRIKVLEAMVERAGLTPDSLPPSGKRPLLVLIRKTITATVLIIAAVVSALRELGFLNIH